MERRICKMVITQELLRDFLHLPADVRILRVSEAFKPGDFEFY